MKPTLELLAAALAPAAPERSAKDRLLGAAIPIQLGGRAATLTFTEPHAPHATVALSLSVGRAVAVLHLPSGLMDWLHQPLGLERSANQEAPPQRAMLTELASLDLIAACEAALATTIRVEPAGSDLPPLPLGLTIASDAGDFAGLLHLPDDLTRELADFADTLAPPELQNAALLAVTLSLRLGRQFLLAEEAASLAPGDVILLEPGPALAVAHGFAAAIALDGEGAILQSEVLPLPAQPDRDGLTEIAFEAARIDMTLGALDALSTGGRLPVAAFGDTAVDIVVGTKVIGRGEPAMLGTASGIRVLSSNHAKVT